LSRSVRYSAATALLALAALSVASLGAAEAPPPPTVEGITATGYRVRVPLGEAAVVHGVVYGFDLDEIDLPGSTPESAGSGPPLPARTILLTVPWGVVPTVAALPGPSRSLGFVHPVPYAYLISDPGVRAKRSGAEVAAALSAPGYTGETGRAGAPMHHETLSAAGGTRLLAVTLRPVTWDPTTSEARVPDEIVLDVRWNRPVEPQAASRPAGPAQALAPRAAVGPAYATLTAAAGGRAAVAQALRIDPSRPWLRLGVVRPGLYVLTSSDLAGAGVPVAGIDPATFRIFRATPGALPESTDVDLAPDSLRECAIEVTGSADGSFDAADRIYFYATGCTGFGYDLRAGGGPEYEEDQWTDTEPLWLTWGPGPVATPPRRIATRDGAPSGAPQVAFVTHRVHYEDNRVLNADLYQPPYRWERWFMRLFLQGSRVPYFVQLPGAVVGGAASVRVRMWGYGLSVGAGLPDHVVRVYWDHQLADTAGWDLYQPQDITASGLRIGTRDTLEIEVPVLRDPGPYPLRADQQYLAWFEVAYPRQLAAIADTLQFAAPDSMPPGRVGYTISSVGDTTAAWLLDRADPESPVRIVGGAWSGSTPSFTLAVEDSVGPGRRPRYSLVSTARAARPAVVALYAPPSSPHVLADLLDPGNGVDYLIVTPPAFLAAAESLAAYRSQGLVDFPSPRARIATTDRVYAQFSAGAADPTAIRNLMAYASRYWSLGAPLYLCLLGDASEDPKNFSGLNRPDLVPTWPNYYNQNLLEQFISDDYFGLLGGPADPLLDVAIGRLPAGDTNEALRLVTGKLRAYEGASDFDIWRARAQLSADDATQRDQPDPVRNDHVIEMERKDRVHIPYPIERSKIYLNDFAFADTTHQSKPAARDAFIAGINAGNWLTEWVGHGAEDVLADEQVFRSQDVPRLTNASRPSLFGFFSCAVGRFDAIGTEPLGELLVTYPGGGAVASLAATRKTFPIQSTQLNDAFVDQLFPAGPRVDSLRTVGLAFALAKNGNVNVTTRQYNLLGDPGLRPPIPAGRGVWEKGPLDSLLRGEAVTLRGHALYPDSTTDSLSTGTVDLLVQGPPIQRMQTAPLDGTRTTYFVPGVTLYRGTAPLDRGAFEARFVVPVDGRIVGSGARLRALLSSAGGRGVGLAVDSVIIASGASSRVDATPPTIRLVYPAGSDSTVRPGQQVTIAIEDSSGIDLTRLDNAHTIFVILDDKGAPTELTPGFSYEPGSATSGTVAYTIPSLAAGTHLLEVHASDTYRNIAVQVFYLEVAPGSASGGGLVLDQVFNYPNPFPRETYLHARLNQAASLRIQILTVAGRRVREIRTDGKAGENYVPWDGRDSEGENVALGVYLFKVTAETPSGSRATAVGRALRIQ
jgi:hypothetical protein